MQYPAPGGEELDMNARRFATCLCGAVFVLSSVLANATPVFINEFHYDNAGTDTGEFVEVAGPAGTDLSAYSIEFYNGATGASYGNLGLSGLIPDLQNGMGVAAFFIAGIQNGSPDGFALLSGSTVIQFLSYEGAFAAIGGPAAGMMSVNIGVSEAGSEAIGLSLQLQGFGRMYEDFTWAGPLDDTPDLVNVNQTFAAAVPEPETYALMLAGLGLLGFMARRRSK